MPRFVIEVWARIEEVMEAETAHQAFHALERKILSVVNLHGHPDKIRCYGPLPSTDNVDCGHIFQTPCQFCEEKK